MYKLEKIVFVKLSGIHIPYHGYTVFSENGKLYMLDTFSMEMLCNVITAQRVYGVRTDLLLCDIAQEFKVLNFIKRGIDDRSIVSEAKSLNAILIKRESGIAFARENANKIERRFTNYLIGLLNNNTRGWI